MALSLAMLAVCCVVYGEPPSSEAQDAMYVEQRHEALRRREITESQYELELRGIKGQLDFDRLQIDDFGGLFEGWFFDVTHTNSRAISRLKVLTRQRDVTGMRAACMAAAVIARDQWRDPDLITLFRAPLVHPGWQLDADPDSIALGSLTRFLRFRLDDMFVPYLWPELERVAQVLVSDTRPKSAEACEWLVRVVSRVSGAAAHPNLARNCELARLKALQAATADDSYGESPRSRQNAIEFLGGPMAKLEYFDHAAPALSALWSSDGRTRTLADVAGKVVVLEFWSTTCGPCVRHIPTMEQVKHECAGRNVAFISVTNAVLEDFQELVHPTDQEVAIGARVLTQFMGSKKMTDTVWITDWGAMEPAYGVKSIPFVVILDANGILRQSGLHPGVPEEIRTAINRWCPPAPVR